MDENEECDEGQIGNGMGLCCTANCKLKANSTCSPSTHDCCSDQCVPKPKGSVCKEKDLAYCFAESQCDGTNIKCPEPEKLPDGSKCLLHGICKKGYCDPTCPSSTHIGCECPNDLCKICCRKNTMQNSSTDPSICSPWTNKVNGDFCTSNGTTMGKCNNGFCEIFEKDKLPILPDIEKEELEVENIEDKDEKRSFEKSDDFNWPKLFQYNGKFVTNF